MAAFVEGMIGGGSGLDPLLELLGCTRYAVDEITYASRTRATAPYIKSSLEEIPKLVWIVAEDFNEETAQSWDMKSMCVCNPSQFETVRGGIERVLSSTLTNSDIIGNFQAAETEGYWFYDSESYDYYFQAGVTYKMISAV